MKMEPLEQSLASLNWNLLMSGCPLFKSTDKFIRVVVCGYRLFLVIAIILFTVHHFYSGILSQGSMLLLLVFTN